MARIESWEVLGPNLPPEQGGQLDHTNLRRYDLANVRIQWDQVVTGFENTDIELTNSITGGSPTFFTQGQDGEDLFAFNVFVGGEDTDGVGGADLGGWTTVHVPPDIVDGGNPGLFIILRYGNPEAAGKTMPINPYAGVAYTISVDESTYFAGSTVTLRFTFEEDVSGFTVGDINLSVGTAGTFTQVSLSEYTLSVELPVDETSLVVSVAEDVVDEGNIARSLTIDYSRVSTRITLDESRVAVSGVVTATVDFSGDVSSFTASDITASIGTKRDFTRVSARQYTIEIVAPANGDGTVNVQIAEDAANPSNTPASASFTYFEPRLQISVDNTRPFIGDTIVATFQFDAGVSQFTASDIDLSVGTAGDFTRVSARQYTLEITLPTGNAGSLTISVDNDVVSPNNVGDTLTIPYRVPTLAISFDKASVANGREVVATFTFGRGVSGFTSSDITVQNGTKGAFTRVSASEYTLVITAPATGTGQIRISVAANAVTPGNVAASRTISYLALVAVAVEFDRSVVYVGDSVVATFTFGAPISGFASGDITVRGGRKGAFTRVSSTVYRLAIFAPDSGSGTIQVSLPQDAVQPLNESVTATIDYLPLPPIDISFDKMAVFVGSVVVVTFDFSIDVTEFVSADVSVTGGRKGTFRQISNRQYTLEITAPSSGDGTIRVSVAENAVEPANALSTASIPYVGLPTLDITFNKPSVLLGETVTATFRFNTDVSQFTADDISVQNGAKGNFSQVSADHYTLVITVPSTGQGRTTVSVAQNAVLPANAPASASVAYIPIPTIDISFNKNLVYGGDSVTATFAFSADVSGFSADDIAVTNGVKSTFQRLAADRYTLAIFAPSTGLGDISLRVAADVVSPGNVAQSATVSYAQRSTVNITFNRNFVFTGDRFVATFDFSEAIDDFVASDVELSDGTKGNLVEVSARQFTMEITAPNGNGNIEVSLAQDAVSPANAPASATIRYMPRPTLTINVASNAFIAGSVRATFNFGSDVSEFTADDILLSNGSKGAFSRVSARQYRLAVNMPTSGSGEVIISVNRDAVEPGNIAASATVTYVTPTATITFAESPILTGRSTRATIVFNAPVSGLTLGDLSVSLGASLLDLRTLDPQRYTVLVTAPAEGAGNIRLSLPTDAVRPGNVAVSADLPYIPLPSVQITFDRVVGIFAGDTVGVTFRFSSAVRGFAASDITASVGRLRNFQSVSATEYAADVVLPSTGSGALVVSVPADSVSPGNVAGTARLIYADRVSLTISLDESSVLIGGIVVATFEFGRAVTNFDIDAIQVSSGAAKSNFKVVSTRVYTVEVEAPLSGSGTVRVEVSADAVNPVNAAASATFNYRSSNDIPIIERVGVQNIALATNFLLRVRIENNPDEVTADGLYEKFYYDWERGSVAIIGTPTSLSFGEKWIIKAKKGNVMRTREVFYNVIPVMPIIDMPEELVVYRGIDNQAGVPISNFPSAVRVEGWLLGLQGGGGPVGALLQGEVQVGTDLTVDVGQANISAMNSGGEDTATGQIRISDLPVFFLLDYTNRNRQMYLINANVETGEPAELLRTIIYPEGLGYQRTTHNNQADPDGFLVYDGYVYITANQPGNEYFQTQGLWKFPVTAADNASPEAEMLELPNSINGRPDAIDDYRGDMYVLLGSYITVFPINALSTFKVCELDFEEESYLLDFVLAVDNGTVYLYEVRSSTYHIFDINSFVHGETPTAERTFVDPYKFPEIDYPNKHSRLQVKDGVYYNLTNRDVVYVGSSGYRVMLIYDENVTEDDYGKYTLRSTNGNIKDVAIDDDYIYCLDSVDNAIYIYDNDKSATDNTGSLSYVGVINPRNTANNGNIDDLRSIDVDDTNIYLATATRLYFIPKATRNNFQPTRYFDYPNSVNGDWIAVDDTYVYIADYSNVYLLLLSTATATEATTARTIDIGDGINANGIAIQGDYAYIKSEAWSRVSFICRFDKNTANNTTAVYNDMRVIPERTITVSEGGALSTGDTVNGLAVDDTYYYYGVPENDNFFRVPLDLNRRCFLVPDTFHFGLSGFAVDDENMYFQGLDFDLNVHTISVVSLNTDNALLEFDRTFYLNGDDSWSLELQINVDDRYIYVIAAPSTAGLYRSHAYFFPKDTADGQYVDYVQYATLNTGGDPPASAVYDGFVYAITNEFSGISMRINGLDYREREFNIPSTRTDRLYFTRDMVIENNLIYILYNNGGEPYVPGTIPSIEYSEPGYIEVLELDTDIESGADAVSLGTFNTPATVEGVVTGVRRGVGAMEGFTVLGSNVYGVFGYTGGRDILAVFSALTEYDTTATTLASIPLPSEVVYGWKITHATGGFRNTGRGGVLSIAPITVVGNAPTRVQNLNTRGLRGGDVELTWEAPTNEGGSPISHYVYRFRELGTNYRRAYTIVSGGRTATSVIVKNLTPGTTYFFEVLAVNESGQGTAAREVSETTPNIDLPRRASRLNAVTHGGGRVVLFWNAATENDMQPISSYVYRYGQGKMGVSDTDDTITYGDWIDTDSTDTEVEITGLPTGSWHTFQVAARNARGVGPEASSAVSFGINAVSLFIGNFSQLAFRNWINGVAVFGGRIYASTGIQEDFINILRGTTNTGQYAQQGGTDTINGRTLKPDSFNREWDNVERGQSVLSGGLAYTFDPDTPANNLIFYNTINTGATRVRMEVRNWYGNIGNVVRTWNIGERYRPLEDITHGDGLIYTLFFDADHNGGDQNYKVRAYTLTGSYRSANSFTIAPSEEYDSNNNRFINSVAGICYDDRNNLLYLCTARYAASADVEDTVFYLKAYVPTTGVEDTTKTFQLQDGIMSRTRNFSRCMLDYRDGKFYFADNSARRMSIFDDPNLS